jgi:hypothetical protein
VAYSSIIDNTVAISSSKISSASASFTSVVLDLLINKPVKLDFLF